MLVSFRHRLVLLAMPKCASSALIQALDPHMDMVIRTPPGAKHTPMRKYERHLRPFLESHAGGPLETFCLVREPVDWLGSWWRYRARPGIPDETKSSKDMTFTDFVAAVLEGAPGPADLGRQAKFAAARDGTIGVDRLFAYEDLPRARAWLEERLGRRIALDKVNVSPKARGAMDLPPALSSRLREGLAADFALHAAALAGEPVTGRRLP